MAAEEKKSTLRVSGEVDQQLIAAVDAGTISFKEYKEIKTQAATDMTSEEKKTLQGRINKALGIDEGIPGSRGRKSEVTVTPLCTWAVGKIAKICHLLPDDEKVTSLCESKEWQEWTAQGVKIITNHIAKISQ